MDVLTYSELVVLFGGLQELPDEYKVMPFPDGDVKVSELKLKLQGIADIIVPHKSGDVVVMSKEKYIRLNRSANHLEYLQVIGVDNWEGYCRPDFDENGDVVTWLDDDYEYTDNTEDE